MIEAAATLRERLGSTIVWAAVVLVASVFFWICLDLISQGISQLSWQFLTSPPQDAGRRGGIGPILISTGLILMVCLFVSLPIGTGTAAFLAEFTHRSSFFGGFIHRSLDVLAGVPSIVFGLFGNAFFCIWLGLGFSILAGGLTLTCMVLPLLIRTTEDALRAVPREYRLAAAALGLSRASVFFRILLPSAMPGLAAGLVLSIGRALAETAALLYTSGYVYRTPESLLDSGRALSIHIFDLAMNVPGGNAQAYASSVVLIVLLVMINLVATWLTARWRTIRVIEA